MATLANDISVSKTEAKLTHTASLSEFNKRSYDFQSDNGFVDMSRCDLMRKIGVDGDVDLITRKIGAVAVA